jgi:hypothetical protein
MSITKIEPNLINANANFTFNAVTATGNLSSFNANLGNAATANFFIGNGSLLTGIAAGNSTAIVNGNSNVIVDANSNVRVSVTGTANVLVISNASANLTGNLQVSGNLTAANITTSGANGNISGANNISANTFTGVLTTASQPNITSIGVLSSLGVTGNVSGGNLSTGGSLSVTGVSNLGSVSNVRITGGTANFVLSTDGTGNLNWVAQSGGGSNISNGTSNVNIPSANGNINLTAAGNTTIVVSGTGANINGTLSVTGNANVGNLGTAGLITATGNITAGNINAGNLLTANFIAGTLTTAAQGNITSLGILSSLTATGNISAGNLIGILANGNSNVRIPSTNGNVTISTAGNANIVVITGTGADITGTANVTGNLSVGGKSNLGPVGNVIITGGTANYVLSTDGVGNLSWVAQSGGGGGSANIAIYDEGNLLTNAVSSLDFVGSGVTATNIGNAVTVTITGGGGGGPASIILDSFTGNGVQTTFTLSTVPQSENYTFVNIDGVSQLKTDYSLSGANIIFDGAPANGALIEVTTVSALSNAQPTFTTRTYTGNGVQSTFTVTNGVTSTGVLVTENGILQTPDSDYTVSGANLTFTSAPANAQAIQIRELGTVAAQNANIANIANTANSVAVANVSGIGNIAITNYNGNGSQVLAGNGAWVDSSGGGGTSSARALGYSLIFGG